MALVVQKFGGTSVADPDRMREVADHVVRTRRRGDDVVLVVSAMGKETDELLRMAGQVAKAPVGREMDMLITAGERKATALVSMALHDRGVPADSFTGSQAGFVTDTNHMNAKILEVRPDRVRQALDEGRVPVVGGSQGVSTEHNVTFFGRGGSDTTAVALANALGGVCELYTDVSGVFTTDPRVVPVARKLSSISFDEMLEMCACGCPKPAMRAVEFARTHKVPLHVRSAFTWEPGTWIDEEDAAMEQAMVSGVVGDDSEAKITITNLPDTPGIAGRLFRGLAARGVNVDMIVQNVSAGGATDISFTLPKDDLPAGREVSDGLAAELGADQVIADDGIGRVSLVGAGMKSHPGVAATVFEQLAADGINIEMISTSAIRISCIVREVDLDRAVTVLHTAFGLDAAPA
ncbi:aspartate kinase [Iamia majanohamensis]|uniref:Aspartokinase n=1 Tax=Iamia majanohamensis TaxID=467976 RepID=A0AAF0BRY0_9ACTN|nr:aspartate kinase [Iamia majanohamensis]WCO67401.1 aspartate kinase [Iamia majanohamensis]